MTTPPIVVLGRDWCDDTNRSRAWMDDHAVPYVYVNIEIDPAGDALIRSYNGGNIVTPTILLGPVGAPVRVLVEPSDDDLASAIAGVAAQA